MRPPPDSLASVARIAERMVRGLGRAVSWLGLAMVLTTATVVVLRKFFDVGFIWMQESVTWMHAAVFMVGAGYTLLHEEHVRVDIFYRNMSPGRRALVDALGVVLFLLPLCGYLAWMAWDFAATSWAISESSREPGGLPYPMIPLLKSIVVLMPVFVALQGVSLLLRSASRLRSQ